MTSEAAITSDDAMRTLRPLGGNVIVEREAGAEVSAGGIVIPEVARDAKEIEWRRGGAMNFASVDYDERRVWARVVAVGPGKMLPNGRRLDPICAPGDRVVLEKWEGLEFRLDGHDLMLVDEGGVLGVVE